MTDDRIDDRMMDDATPQDDLPEWLQDAAGDDDSAPPQKAQQRISTTTLLAMLTVVGIIVVIGYALYESQRKPESLVGKDAPDFGVTVYDTDLVAQRGERLTNESLAGQVIVLNFWADYCVPCQAEAPMFERMWNDYKAHGVIFLGINTENPLPNALQFLTDYGITYPNGPDEADKMWDAYNVTGIPETFVIDINGVVREHYISSPGERDFRAVIDLALEGPESLVGKDAPDFGVTVYDTDLVAQRGERLTNESLAGQVIVLNFWADYCVPCQAEAPMFERLWNDYKDRGVIFLGINTENPLTDALQFLTDYGITYPNGPDEAEKMWDAYHVTGIPETFVIDINGVVREHYISSPGERDFRAVIDLALEG